MGMGCLLRATPTWCAWLTAATTFLAGFPRVECCRVIDRARAPKENTAGTACCCCGGEKGEKESEPSCPCCTHHPAPKETGTDVDSSAPPEDTPNPPAGGLQIGHAGCAKILVRPDHYVSTASRTAADGDLQTAPLLSQAAAGSLNDFSPFHRPVWAVPLIAPPTDLLALLQHLLI